MKLLYGQMLNVSITKNEWLYILHKLAVIGVQDILLHSRMGTLLLRFNDLKARLLESSVYCSCRQ